MEGIAGQVALHLRDMSDMLDMNDGCPTCKTHRSNPSAPRVLSQQPYRISAQSPEPLFLPAFGAMQPDQIVGADAFTQALMNSAATIEAQITSHRLATRQGAGSGSKPPYYDLLLANPVFVGEFFCVPLSKILLDLAMLGPPRGGLAAALRALVTIGGKGAGNRLEGQVQALLIYQRANYKNHESAGYGKGGNAGLAKFWSLLTSMGTLLGISPCCFLHFAIAAGIMGGTGILSTGSRTPEGNPLLHSMILVGADCSAPTKCVLAFLDQSNSNASVLVTIGNPPSFNSEGSIIGTAAGMNNGNGGTPTAVMLQTVLVIIV